MHHAYFCRYQQGTVASFLNPDLTNKPWDVHFYCVLMACGDGVPVDEEEIVKRI